jgi:hypothetical protein
MELARALMTTPGLQARHRRHPHFISAVERTMAPLLEGQSALEQKQIAALIFVMANLSTWLAMCDEAGLSPDASRQAAAWAISVLLAEIRRGARPRDLDLREILP